MHVTRTVTVSINVTERKPRGHEALATMTTGYGHWSIQTSFSGHVLLLFGHIWQGKYIRTTVRRSFPLAGREYRVPIKWNRRCFENLLPRCKRFELFQVVIHRREIIQVFFKIPFLVSINKITIKFLVSHFACYKFCVFQGRLAKKIIFCPADLKLLTRIIKFFRYR